MLDELSRLHEELLEALAGMERAVGGTALDRNMVAAARLRLTQANGRRRKLVYDRIFPILEQAGDSRGLEAIRQLKAAEAEMMSRSREHIARWTLEAITGDWPGYQQASARIRAGIRDRVVLERLLLYPLLGRLSSSADSPSGRSTSPRPAPAAGMPRSQAG